MIRKSEKEGDTNSENSKDKEIISENSVWEFVKKIFNDHEEELEKVKVFYDPSIEVRIKWV